MKDTYTSMETITTGCGNTVIFRPDQLGTFFKKTYEENYLTLTPEEVSESFGIDQEYGDLLIKIIKEPLHDILIDYYGAEWALQDKERDPIEEYNYALSKPKDEDMTEEEHNLKMERLRLHKEWFEQQQ